MTWPADEKLTMTRCPFCAFVGTVVAENELAFACYDLHPVNPGHLLIVARRHVANWFDTTPEEKVALLALVDAGKRVLDARFAPAGYNIGINVGETAGQTIPHLHIHLIPRFRGDCTSPRGGVRGVIPERQSYPASGGTPHER